MTEKGRRHSAGHAENRRIGNLRAIQKPDGLPVVSVSARRNRILTGILASAVILTGLYFMIF